jgi:hypothetical protein
MAAAVQRIAIEAERHRFTFRHTRRTVLMAFSMMLVQASERHGPAIRQSGDRRHPKVDEYRKWTRGELKDRPAFPDDIPAWPYDVYGKDKNWKGMSDFLGTR